jgi:hypothetical protein
MSETTASFDAVIKALRMLKKIRRLEGTVLIHEGVLVSADTLLHDSQNDAFVREVNALISLYRNSGNGLSRAVLGFDGGNVALFHAAPFTLALFFGDMANAAAVEKAGEDFLHQWADSLKIVPGVIGHYEALDPKLLSEVGNSLPAVDPAKDDPVEVDVDESDEETIPIVAIPVAGRSEEDFAKTEQVEESVPEPEPDKPAAEELPVREDIATSSRQSQPMEESPEKRWSAYRAKLETLFSKVLGRAQATRLLERELTAMGIEDGGYLATSQFRPFGQKLIKKVKDRTLRKQLELELVSIVESFVD